MSVIRHVISIGGVLRINSTNASLQYKVARTRFTDAQGDVLTSSSPEASTNLEMLANRGLKLLEEKATPGGAPGNSLLSTFSSTFIQLSSFS